MEAPVSSVSLPNVISRGQWRRKEWCRDFCLLENLLDHSLFCRTKTKFQKNTPYLDLDMFVLIMPMPSIISASKINPNWQINLICSSSYRQNVLSKMLTIRAPVYFYFIFTLYFSKERLLVTSLRTKIWKKLLSVNTMS